MEYRRDCLRSKLAQPGHQCNSDFLWSDPVTPILYIFWKPANLKHSLDIRAPIASNNLSAREILLR